jgi:hypothetical protein
MDNKDSCHVLGHVALAVKNDGAIISSGGKKISAEGVGGGTARAVRAPTKFFVTCTIVEDKGSRKKSFGKKEFWKKEVGKKEVWKKEIGKKSWRKRSESCFFQSLFSNKGYTFDLGHDLFEVPCRQQVVLLQDVGVWGD